MSHTERFQGTRNGAQVQGQLTHHYRNIGPCISSPYSSLTSWRWKRSHKPDFSDKWSTSPNSRLAPLPFAKKLTTAGTGEVIIPTDYNCASRHQSWVELKIGPRGPESASLPPQHSHHLLAHSVLAQRELDLENSYTGHKTWRMFSGSQPVPAGSWQPNLRFNFNMQFQRL